MSGFYEAGPLAKVGINLFYGYGYNFYRQENQLRADDQRVRQMACSLLGRARAGLDQAESRYRRENIAPPSRANPFPDPAVVANAQALERLGREVGGLEGLIRHQPVPENDRMTQRYRLEAATLAALAEKDAVLVGQAELLRSMVEGAAADSILASKGEIETGIAAIKATLHDRQMFLL
jgi:predicted regulator of Ras-like GTPase activity (Roadblock/LC7/MglB family)